MQFSNQFLEKKRFVGDFTADLVIEEIFSSENKQQIYQQLAKINHNKDLQKADLPLFLKEYFIKEANIPQWADKQRMQEAWIFFENYSSEILGMLGFLSLPYCYAAAKGANVLYFSEKIRSNTYRRLIETSQFVLDVMQKNSFSEAGKGWTSLLKVRLMHATVRYHLKKHKEWNQDWGIPINQEDMAGTNIAFSLITLRGLRKMNYSISTQEAESFIHLWNVIGDRLGITKELLPEGNREAFWLEKYITERQFQPSEAGKVLTKTLIKVLNEPRVNTPSMPEGFITTYMRFLLGEKTANILGIPQSNWTTNVVKALQFITWAENFFDKKFQVMNENFLPILRKELQENPVEFVN